MLSGGAQALTADASKMRRAETVITGDEKPFWAGKPPIKTGIDFPPTIRLDLVRTLRAGLRRRAHRLFLTTWRVPSRVVVLSAAVPKRRINGRLSPV